MRIYERLVLRTTVFEDSVFAKLLNSYLMGMEF